MATQTAVQVEAEIIGAFEHAGYTPAQAAGVAGNAQTESGFRPTAYNAREGAVGLFQVEGGRLDALKAYAARTGGSIWDAATQIGFTIQEAASRGNASQVKATTTAQQAAYVWDRKYEVSSTESIPQREANAANIFAQIQSGHLTGTLPQTPTGAGGYGTGLSANLTAAQIASIHSDIAPGGGLDPLNWPGDILGGFSSAAGSVAGGVASAVESWLTAIAKPIVNFFLDGALFFIGFIMIIVGLVVLSKAGDESGQTVITEPGGKKDDDGEKAGGEDSAAEDAAVAA